MSRDCFLLGNINEPRLEPIMIPSKNRFIAYYTPINASSKWNKRNLGRVRGTTIC